MGNRISFDEISKQLRSIYGVILCYIQDEIQNDAPYLIRYGQFESVIGNLCKKTTNSFIRLKSLHRTQDVILHHCQGETCDLGGKMYGLALAQVQQGLTLLVCDFGSPTSGVYTICLKKAEGKIGCQQAVPITFATSFAEEQTNRYAIQLNVHRAICAAKSSVMLTCLRLLLVPDDLLGIHLTRFCGVVGLAQLYHAQQMTLDISKWLPKAIRTLVLPAVIWVLIVTGYIQFLGYLKDKSWGNSPFDWYNINGNNGPAWFLYALLYVKLLTWVMVKSRLPKIIIGGQVY